VFYCHNTITKSTKLRSYLKEKYPCAPINIFFILKNSTLSPLNCVASYLHI